MLPPRVQITNIRLAQDEAESRRRTEEEARRQELRQKMLQEAEQRSASRPALLVDPR